MTQFEIYGTAHLNPGLSAPAHYQYFEKLMINVNLLPRKIYSNILQAYGGNSSLPELFSHNPQNPSLATLCKNIFGQYRQLKHSIINSL